jgi:hypothetical protein
VHVPDFCLENWRVCLTISFLLRFVHINNKTTTTTGLAATITTTIKQTNKENTIISKFIRQQYTY